MNACKIYVSKTCYLIIPCHCSLTCGRHHCRVPNHKKSQRRLRQHEKFLLVYAYKHRSPYTPNPLQAKDKTTRGKEIKGSRAYCECVCSGLETGIDSSWKAEFLYSLVADELADTVVDLVGRVGSVTGSERAKNEEHADDNSGEDHQLAENGPGVAKLLPLHAALAEVLLQLLSAELVVHKTTKRNSVTESLERGDGVLEEEHGGKDEENVLEYTGEGKDERGGLANLKTCKYMHGKWTMCNIPRKRPRR